MTMSLRTIRDIPWKQGMRVLIRIDADVAMNKNRITDDFRITQALPTIQEALRRGARIRILSHRGRPHGSVVPSLSQRSIATYFSRVLARDVVFVDNPTDDGLFSRFDSSPEILYFENLRFWNGEEENSRAFVRMLARWGDVYINDAFANCHRDHASMVGLAKVLSSYAGVNLEKEISTLGRVLTEPHRPLVAILGGAKLETKIPLIKQFLKSADHILIGGAIANTFFAARGFPVGKSLVDEGYKKADLLKWIKQKKLHLPSDVVTATQLSKGSSVRSCGTDGIRGDEYSIDIGPRTRAAFSSIVASAGMVVWNGPMGFAEIIQFAPGTRELAKQLQRSNAFTIVGGGDTIAVLRTYKALHGFSYISTGGGAMLEFLTGKKIRSIELLKGKQNISR